MRVLEMEVRLTKFCWNGRGYCGGRPASRPSRSTIKFLPLPNW